MAGGSFSKGDATVDVLEVAAHERLEDAEALLSSGRYSSAIAMGLYSLEITLKVVICKRLDLDKLPKPFEIHELDQLLIVSGLSGKVARTKKPRGIKKNWDELAELCKNSDKFRYSSDPAWDQASASRTLRQLRDPPGGILPWLSKQA